MLLGIPPADAVDWNEMSSLHFLVYYTKNKKFAKETLDNAEYYYERIATEIGYPRHSEFWLWDERCKIYIYPDRKSFLEATNQPSWSHGMAEYNTRTIASFVGSKEFLDSILPHEMGHLIFRDFVGFKGQDIKIWLDEGVAQWSEIKKRGEMKAMTKDMYENDSLLLLSDLIRLDIRKYREMDRVFILATRTKENEDGVLFLDADSFVNTYYLCSVSVIGFLIEKYGSDRFARFCRQLRDGDTVEAALKFAYPDYINSIDELEAKWREYLAEY
jgi:hypothetical protein